MVFENKIIDARRHPVLYIKQLKSTMNENPLEENLILLTAVSVNKEFEIFSDIYTYVKKQLESSENLLFSYYFNEAAMVFNRSARDLDCALKHGIEANALSHKLNRRDLVISSLRYISTVYFRLNDVEMAFYYILKAIELTQKDDDESSTAETYMVYGVLLFEQKNYEHAKSAYEKSLAYYQQVEGAEKTAYYYKLMMNLGEVTMYLGNLNAAEMFFNRAVRLGEKYGYEQSLNAMYLTLAEFYKQKGDYENAFSVLQLYIQKLTQIVDVAETRPDYTAVEVKDKIDQLDMLQQLNDSLVKKLTKLHQEHQLKSISFETDAVLSSQLNAGFLRNEIHAYYQFKWCPQTNQPVGAEALVRWIKDGEIIPPGEYIHRIEESEDIIELSKIVMMQAITTLKIILDNYNDSFVMSINITPYQLMNQSLATDIEKFLLINHVPAKNFEIEITERSFIEQNPKIIDELYKIKALGVHISLDDFGTGYSSLACINEFPIDVIKIDRNLIRDLTTDKKARKLIKGVVEMMHNLDLIVVAEGVETALEVETLSHLKCDQLQGYYYSRPTDQKSFTDLICQHFESSISV